MDDVSKDKLNEVQDKNSNTPFHVIIVQMGSTGFMNSGNTQSDTGNDNWQSCRTISCDACLSQRKYTDI